MNFIGLPPARDRFESPLREKLAMRKRVMETRHIRYFLAAYDELNFTRAAKKCGISQPSFTNAIRRLEREVGGALFLRSMRPPYVQPTALGRKLHPVCIKMNELLKKAGSIRG